MQTTHTESELKKAVRDRYARAATEESGCCDPGCCGDAADRDATEVGMAIGYTDSDLEGLPADANLGLGCGNPTALASLSEGETVLDLGSGAGIDCFLAARKVGPGGRVIGVDMTPEMLDRARANATAGGYENVDFRLGEIEALPVADATVDVVISNCVLNLSSDRARALREVFRVLKPGGRLVVSDLVSEREAPAAVRSDLDAVAGCLPTQRERYLEEFRAAGFGDVRIASETPYPSDYLLSDDRVKAFLAENPSLEAELAGFAGSIAGAHFEATRP